MRIITYYTESYRKHMLRLVQSASIYGYKVKTIRINEIRTWGHKIAIKPQLLLQEYKQYGGNFLYLDADTEILGKIDQQIFQNQIHVRERNLDDKYNLGVIYLGQSDSIYNLLEQWVHLTKQEFGNSKSVDQEPFSQLISQSSHLKIGQLPYQYNFLPADLAEHSKDEAIIYHHKASRANQDYKDWMDEIGAYYGPNIMKENTGLSADVIELKPQECDLTDLYEDGKIIIVPRMKFEGMNNELIHSIKPEQLNHIPIKKNKGHWMMERIGKDYTKHPIYNYFPKDRPTGEYFQKQVKLFNKHITNYVAKHFPKYKIIDKHQWSWRFGIIQNEDMHVDSYERGDHESHLLRIFYNYDSKPRIWRISHPVSTLIEYLKQTKPDVWKDLRYHHPNKVNAIINKNIDWTKQPYIQLEIQPYSLMFVNTQVQSHQIVWGRKLCAYSWVVAPSSMNDQNKNFVNLVRHLTIANQTQSLCSSNAGQT